MRQSRTYIAPHPGLTIKEQLSDRGMTQKEFALRMGMSEKHISRLINGDVLLTNDMAMRLEMVLGLPAKFWNSLEAIYREELAKVDAEKAMDEDIDIAKKMPYNEMFKNDWVPKETRLQERVVRLRKYFELTRLSMLNDPAVPGIACRRMGSSEKADYALLAWAQQAKLQARKIDTCKIDTEGLRKEIGFIRSMTLMEPNEFCPRLIALLAEYGVALVFLPHIGGSFLHGATFFDNNKIVLGMTVRGKDADRFWFSLFHELGHIVLGHIKKDISTSEEEEIEADKFARETLIPSVDFEAFTTDGTYTIESIKNFAGKEGVDTGIVVGRLQKEGFIRFEQYNRLKTKYMYRA